jgi:hypothetical protein
MVCCIYVELEDESCESSITSNITGKKIGQGNYLLALWSG